MITDCFLWRKFIIATAVDNSGEHTQHHTHVYVFDNIRELSRFQNWFNLNVFNFAETTTWQLDDVRLRSDTRDGRAKFYHDNQKSCLLNWSLTLICTQIWNKIINCSVQNNSSNYCYLQTARWPAEARSVIIANKFKFIVELYYVRIILLESIESFTLWLQSGRQN